MKDNPTILIIRFRRVGDAVLSSTLCTSLRQSIPGATIHYVLNEHIAPLFEHHHDIDRLITFSDYDMSNTMRYLWKVRQIMNETKYDIVIDTRSTLKTLLFALFSLKSDYRIGRSKFYSFLLHNYRIGNYFDGTRDNVQCTLDLLNPLSKSFEIKRISNYKLYLTEKENDDFRAYMIRQGVNLDKPIIVCAVATRLEYKMWNKDKIREVLMRILSNYPDIQLIFNYCGDVEKTHALNLHKVMNNHPRVFTNVEATNLREVLAMLSNASLFFGNEGGPRHIAQGLDIPSLAIYPPYVSKKEWLPSPSEIFQGIEYLDIAPEFANGGHSLQEKFDLINAEFVWLKLNEMLQKIHC